MSDPIPDSTYQTIEFDVTMAGTDVDQVPAAEAEPANEEIQLESCLVQIYPADVVDGMILVGDEALTIGRDPSSQIALTEKSVSRKHAQIWRAGKNHHIRDLNSTNGTIVNGQKVEEHHLQSGDTIRFGVYLFKYLSAGSVESQYHETVYSALTRDALTGAFNKRYLLESMVREMAFAVRHQFPVSVVMLDIDYFKRVNDQYGHLVGDEVLREFGSRIMATKREHDMLSRYGGEEFCLFLSATDQQGAMFVAERCRNIIAAQPFPTASGNLSVTASFGVACFDPKSATEVANVITVEQLIKLADDRLYEAKRNGRNQVCG